MAKFRRQPVDSKENSVQELKVEACRQPGKDSQATMITQKTRDYRTSEVRILSLASRGARLEF